MVNNQYSRNDLDINRGRFRLRGDVLEIGPAYEDRLIRIEFFGDEIEAIRYVNPITGEILKSLDRISIYPAKHFVTPKERLEAALVAIREELVERLDVLHQQNQLVEAQRLEQRTMYDLDMLQEMGYCNGVENYARHLTGRPAGTPPECLVDYFTDDWLLVVDESHVTCSQLQGMYNGDRSRKQVLINHGFRLPSAADNRPLKAEEFWTKVKQAIFVSATPGAWELRRSGDAVRRQVIRPTGVVDPRISVRPSGGQVDDLLGEIRARSGRGERTLVTTLTKRMAEDLCDYLASHGVKVQYLHSEIHSIERIELIQDLRLGTYDVLVGVNLLREGLDLPEVSLVAILDADKEGFLRSDRSLIQTIGRAARHVHGMAILYGDQLTDSMAKAIEETERRRQVQQEYNSNHGITPKAVATKNKGNPILADLELSRRLSQSQLETATVQAENDDMPLAALPELISQLEDQMKTCAQDLKFEEAAKLRDRIRTLRQKLVGSS